MLTQLETKNVKRIASSITGFKTALDAARAKADAIDEKYRKMAEEKKGTLMQEIASLEEEIEFWQNAIVSRYGDEATPLLNELMGEAAEEEVPAADPEDVVTESPVEEEVKDEAPAGLFDESQSEDLQKADEEEESDPDAEEDAEWDEKIESGEIAEVETPVEAGPTLAEESNAIGWDDEEKSENSDSDEDEEWPEPEEWKD